MRPNPYIAIFAATCAIGLFIFSQRVKPSQNDRAVLARAQTLVATAKGNSEQLNEASRLAGEAIERDPLQIHALFVQGWALQELGKPHEAAQSYETALAQISEISKYANFNLSLIYEAKGNIDAALQLLVKTTNEDPKMVVGWIKMVRLLISKGRLDEAREVVNLALAENPTHPDLESLVKELASAKN